MHRAAQHRAGRLCLPEQVSSVLAAHLGDGHMRPSAAASAAQTKTEGGPAQWRACGGLDSAAHLAVAREQCRRQPARPALLVVAGARHILVRPAGLVCRPPQV